MIKYYRLRWKFSSLVNPPLPVSTLGDERIHSSIIIIIIVIIIIIIVVVIIIILLLCYYYSVDYSKMYCD